MCIKLKYRNAFANEFTLNGSMKPAKDMCAIILTKMQFRYDEINFAVPENWFIDYRLLLFFPCDALDRNTCSMRSNWWNAFKLHKVGLRKRFDSIKWRSKKNIHNYDSYTMHSTHNTHTHTWDCMTVQHFQLTNLILWKLYLISNRNDGRSKESIYKRQKKTKNKK